MTHYKDNKHLLCALYKLPSQYLWLLALVFFIPFCYAVIYFIDLENFIWNASIIVFGLFGIFYVLTPFEMWRRLHGCPTQFGIRCERLCERH
jgi:hypothetical protein